MPNNISSNHDNAETVILDVSVIYIKFRASDSDFRIIAVCDKEGNSFSAKGSFGDTAPGTDIKIYGTWGAPYKGQPTFLCAFYEEILPTAAEEILAFLSTGVFPGIGPAIAKRIVDRFGDKSFDILDNDPDRLIEISGIGEKKKERIRNGWEKKKSIQVIGRYLFKLGVPIRYTERIHKQFGDKAVSVIKENPYALCEVKGIGFMTADKIAMKNGIEKDNPYRVASGILYVIGETCAFGHTYAVYQEAANESVRLLGVERELVASGFLELSVQKKIVIDEEAVYPYSLYLAETGVAAKLGQLVRSEPLPCSAMPIEDIEENIGIRYDEIQASAITSAADESVLVITGGPGTGKSSILSGILMQFEASGLTVKLAAPTGRAAKRMAEVTGDKEAATIHRMLLSLECEGSDYIDADVVVIDETSMVDVSLLNWLLSCIQPGTRLIMIGDADQLPSVGPGTVLRDVIKSGICRTIKLEKIFRQDGKSMIAENARKINKGERGLIVNRSGCGFYFYKTDKGAEYIEDKVVEIVTKQVPETYGYSIDDIQVLSPIRRPDRKAGTTRINQKIRDVVNPLKDGMEEVHGLRVNDRVMNTQNDYKKNVFNGDTGSVVAIDTEDKTITIDFDGNLVEYDFGEVDDSIVLCYAVTVHKAQGSEYPVVVMPVTMGHYIMLQRTLFYTAVTRAKKMIVLVGEEAAINRAIQNTSISERHGRLYERLLAECRASKDPQKEQQQTQKETNNG